MGSRRTSLLVLCLLALPLSGATLADRIAPASAVQQYARFLADDATDVRGASSVDGPTGSVVAGFVGGAYTSGGVHHGLVVALRNCPDGICFGTSFTLASLRPRSVPTLHPLVDLSGGAGPLVREPAGPVAMAFGVLPVVSEHRHEDRSETRLTLLSAADPSVRVLDEAIAVHHATGRRFEGTGMRLVEGEGGTLDLLFDWKVWPGRNDHDAACLHDPVVRRFRLVDGRYREQPGAGAGCR